MYMYIYVQNIHGDMIISSRVNMFRKNSVSPRCARNEKCSLQNSSIVIIQALKSKASWAWSHAFRPSAATENLLSHLDILIGRVQIKISNNIEKHQRYASRYKSTHINRNTCTSNFIFVLLILSRISYYRYLYIKKFLDSKTSKINWTTESFKER